MKSHFTLLLTLLVSQFTFAQPVSKLTEQQKKELKELEEEGKKQQIDQARMIERAAVPYLKVNSFSGTFDLSLTEQVGEDFTPVFKCQMKTIYRLDRSGNKIREVTVLTSRTKKGNKFVSQTVKVVDDGKTQTRIAVESKTYALTQRYNEVAPFALLNPAFTRIARAYGQEEWVIPATSKGILFGRAYTGIDGIGYRKQGRGMLTDTEMHGYFDDKTSTFNSLEWSSGKRGVEITASKQIFNLLLNESQFKWTPPADFKRVAENQLPNPMQGLAPNPKPTTALVY